MRQVQATKMNNLLSFDIEISDVFDDLAPGENWNDRAPFHISVAATVEVDGHISYPALWYSPFEVKQGLSSDP